MKIGKPDDYLDKRSFRLRSIDRSIAQYRISAYELKKTFADKLDSNVFLFLKGFGNEVNLLSAFRDLFFNSRELLDLLLLELNKATDGKEAQTPRDFLPFAKKLMQGVFDQKRLPTLTFLKTNITYIFHIRKVRNEIKNNPANIEFLFKTDHFEACFRVPIKADEVELVQYLDIANKDEAVRNKSYRCTYILDTIFPEMLVFWKTAFSLLDSDINRPTNE
ncbi:MAG: hypothetical protein K9L59_07945 [Desulfobacterales bacterium]|nr:hypothetical protein [Desulfobacterales bacterium]